MSGAAYETGQGPKWVLLDEFCTQTGYTTEAVIMKRKKGIWPDGVITQIRCRRIHVNLQAYDEWVESGKIKAA